MSEPSYRINTEHRPEEVEWAQWTARVTQLSDGSQVDQEWAKTEDRVIEKAQQWIAARNTPTDPGRVLFADESGSITEGAAA